MTIFRNMVAFIIRWLTHTNEPKDHGLSDFDKIRQQLKPCDVMLIQGRGRADKTIQTISHSPWSHAALYVGRPLDIEDQDLKAIIGHYFDGPSDTPLLIESKLGEGISVKPLLAYENEHIRICRPKSLSAKDAQQIVRFAVNRIGSHQGGNNLLDLIRFFFPWGLLPFSWRKPTFLHWAGRNTRNTTAAFVAESFGFIQFPLYPLVKTSSDHGVQLLRRHPKLCLPFEFDLSPSFEIIKYPVIDFQVYENERLIPWKGSGDFSGMEQDTALVYQSGVKKLNSDGEAADGTGAGPGENNEQDDPKVTSINSRPE